MHKEEAENYLHKKVEKRRGNKSGFYPMESKIILLILMEQSVMIFLMKNLNEWLLQNYIQMP